MADPRFPRGGVNTRGGAPHCYHLAKKGAKLHELQKKLDRGEAPASSAPPLRSTTVIGLDAASSRCLTRCGPQRAAALSTRISSNICLHSHPYWQRNTEGTHNPWETWEESCWIVRPQQKRLLFEVKPSKKNLHTRVQEFS